MRVRQGSAALAYFLYPRRCRWDNLILKIEYDIKLTGLQRTSKDFKFGGSRRKDDVGISFRQHGCLLT